jgi:hypothetical protein
LTQRWLLGAILGKELFELALIELDLNQAYVAKCLRIARGTVIDKIRKNGLK